MSKKYNSLSIKRRVMIQTTGYIQKYIQKEIAWRYPCEKPIWIENKSDMGLNTVKIKKDLHKHYDGSRDGGGCPCGKHCKPEKIIIIAMKA